MSTEEELCAAALENDRSDWFLDHEAEPEIASHAFERGWEAARAVSLPDLDTIAKTILTSQSGGPHMAETVIRFSPDDWEDARTAARAVLAALSAQPVAEEIETRPTRSAANLIAERRSRGLTAADLPYTPSVYASDLGVEEIPDDLSYEEQYGERP